MLRLWSLHPNSCGKQTVTLATPTREQLRWLQLLTKSDDTLPLVQEDYMWGKKFWWNFQTQLFPEEWSWRSSCLERNRWIGSRASSILSSLQDLSSELLLSLHFRCGVYSGNVPVQNVKRNYLSLWFRRALLLLFSGLRYECRTCDEHLP